MYLFEPREGTVLMGTVNKVGSDHIGLLVEGTWNASIPRSMIPDQYEFDQELGVWCDKDFDHPHIDAGCAIPFVVTDTEVMGEVLSINGSLKDVNQLARCVSTHCAKRSAGAARVSCPGAGHGAKIAPFRPHAVLCARM